ncbi:MAG: metallophosphoesterase, partial [Candidatus Woesearchaeota archaeon]
MLQINKLNIKENLKKHAKEYISVAIFFIIFIIIYYYLNLFVLSTYLKLFNLVTPGFFNVLVIFLTLSYLLAAGLEYITDNYPFRLLYLISSVWMGVLFISFSVLLIYYLIDLIMPITTLITGIIILTIVIIISIYGIVNAYTINVIKVNVSNNKGAKLKAVQISDVHLGVITGDAYFKKIISKTNSLNPDVVFITGDLFDGNYSYDANTLKLLNAIHAKIYFITGNHEEYTGLDKVKELLKETKVIWLRNELVRYKGMNIIGLDDTRDKSNVGIMLSNISKKHDLKSSFNILLNHRPIGWKSA